VFHFGPKIILDSSQVFLLTRLSFAFVNLKPVLSVLVFPSQLDMSEQIWTYIGFATKNCFTVR